MSSYITHTKPSFFQVFLNKLGIIDLPIKVNCWYCNQNSFLLPGSKNTVKHWYCHLCENVNSRDDKGDIIDPSPIETNVERSFAPFATRSPSVVKKNSENTICDECQDNLNLIQSILQDYIPDESDPTYSFKYENVDQYTAELHQRYRLCNNCREKLTRLSEEQKEYLRKIKVNTLLKDSLKTKIPVRPRKSKFYIKGTFWVIAHIATLLYVLHALIYPPPEKYFDESRIDFYYEYLKNLDLKSISMDPIVSLYEHIWSFDSSLVEWAKNNQLQVAFVTNLLSLPVLTWHPIQLNSFFDSNETSCWNFYKGTEYLLFLMRIAFIFLTHVNVTSRIYLVALLTTYYALLFISFKLVKVKTSFGPLKMVGKSFSSHTIIEDENEVSDVPTYEDNMSIVNEEVQPVVYTSHQDPLDNIVDGVDRIRF